MSDSKKKSNDKSRIVTKKVPTKLQAIGDNVLEYSGANLLPGKEGFSVVMASSVNRLYMTFHHPIGKTTLEDDDWVATETSQIQFLLDRRVDPRRKVRDAARTLDRFASAVTATLITEHEGEYYYPSDNAHLKSRTSHVAEARKEAKEAKDLSAAAYVSRIVDERRVEEVALRGHLSSDAVVNAAIAGNPYDAFTTRSGLHETVEQVAVGYLEKKSIADAKLAVARRLLGI